MRKVPERGVLQFQIGERLSTVRDLQYEASAGRLNQKILIAFTCERPRDTFYTE